MTGLVTAGLEHGAASTEKYLVTVGRRLQRLFRRGFTGETRKNNNQAFRIA